MIKINDKKDMEIILNTLKTVDIRLINILKPGDFCYRNKSLEDIFRINRHCIKICNFEIKQILEKIEGSKK